MEKIKEEKIKFPEKELARLIYTLHFFPIISNTSKINSIIIAVGTSEVTTAMIMAGGLGSRLGKITKNIPKPLLLKIDRFLY